MKFLVFVFFLFYCMWCEATELKKKKKKKKKDQRASFYFLQKTFSDQSDESSWRREWVGEIIFSHGIRHRKGVCILIDPSIKNYKVV